MQAIKVTLAILLLSICVLFTLRFYGLSQRYQVYDHPLMKASEPWVFAWGGDTKQGPSHSLPALRSASRMKGVILGLSVQMNAEKHFYAIPQDWEGSVESSQTRFIDMNDQQVKSLVLGDGKPPMSLESVFQTFPETPLFLWIKDNAENIDLRLEPLLKRYAVRQNILIHSEYDNVVKSLKALMPEILYGTGVGQRIRMLMLSDLWLETVGAIDGDFVVSSLKEKGITVISPEMMREVARRQKIFILGPLNNPEDNKKALAFGASGYLTADPQDLKNKLNARATTVDLSRPGR